MNTTVKWTIGIGIALAALIVGIGTLIQTQASQWQRAQEQVANQRHENLMSQMSGLQGRIESLQRTADEGQRAALRALAIAVRNHRNDPVVVATGSQSEIVEILDYLDDIPGNLGSALEEGAGDVVEEFENVLESLGDLF